MSAGCGVILGSKSVGISTPTKAAHDTPKNDKSRTVEIASATSAALSAMRDRQTKEPLADVGQLVFRRPTRRGFEPWRPDVTTHVFQRLSANAKVPVVPFHHLRHACASWLLSDGMDVVAVSERLGHWSPSLTRSTNAHAIAADREDSPAPSVRRSSRFLTWFLHATSQADPQTRRLRRSEHIRGGSSVGQSRGLIIRIGASRGIPGCAVTCNFVSTGSAQRCDVQ
jgi:hypothetical protein